MPTATETRSTAPRKGRAAKPLTPDAAALAAEYVPWCDRFAAHKARRMSRHLAEEVRSAALVGLCEAARDFDPGWGVKFTTYAYHRCRSAALDALRAESPKGFRRKADAPAVVPTPTGETGRETGDGGPCGTALDLMPAGELPVGWEAESADEVLAFSRRLPRRHGEAVRLLFLGAGTTTQAAVAKAMGVSPSRASQIFEQVPPLADGRAAHHRTRTPL